MSADYGPAKRYVHGFSFSRELDRVVLVLKDRPDTPWHGTWMGLGGKVEPGETVFQAMVREFLEESGAETFESDWRWFATLEGVNFHRDRDGDLSAPFEVFNFFSVGDFWQTVRTAEREVVEVARLQHLATIAPRMYPNATWLLPMALSIASGREPRARSFGVIQERQEVCPW